MRSFARIPTTFVIVVLVLLISGCPSTVQDSPNDTSANADLADLELSGATLDSAFDPAKTSYTATVENGVSEVSLIPKADHSAASITVNGSTVSSGSASDPISLPVGTTDITVEVTAEDGSTNTYTVSVTRKKAVNTNASLASLSLSEGSLSPAFDPATTNYTVSVANSVTEVTVTPTVDDTNATVTVHGTAVSSGSASDPISLSVGTTDITVEVTAEDGSTKSYTISVTREEAVSANADLSDLALSEGTLSPAFDSGTTSYTATVNGDVSDVTVTPTTASSEATVTVEGNAVNSGSASQPISLSDGPNNIDVTVTAENGNTKSYAIELTRLSDNADLASLTVTENDPIDGDSPSNVTLSPGFDPGTTSYSAEIPGEVPEFTVTPDAADDDASVTVDGASVSSGSASSPITVPVFNSATATIEVTAEDGSTKTYDVTVTRGAVEDDIEEYETTGTTKLVVNASYVGSAASVGSGHPLRIRVYNALETTEVTKAATTENASVEFTPGDIALGGDLYIDVWVDVDNNGVPTSGESGETFIELPVGSRNPPVPRPVATDDELRIFVEVDDTPVVP
jgi:hypothetical protein